LLLHCWAHVRAGQAACPPPVRAGADGATVLFDLQVHRDGASDDLVQRFVERILAALDPAAVAAGVYYAGRLGAGPRRALRRCGFVDAAAPGETL
jgi:hypothetical protein